MRLGYVYAYDRCEGRYFRSYYNNFGEVPPKPDTDVLTDIAAGTSYTKYMIEEDDTMDEVVKADSSAGKT